MQIPRLQFVQFPRAALTALLFTSTIACKMPNNSPDTLPRNEHLPLFDAHMPAFTCEVESTKVPPIDAQAEAWFLEARALESPDIFVEDRDYKKILELTRNAAARKHWKAMLNLASLYLEKHDPARSVDDALNLVEDAMRLGIPAAYDRMGTYYMNGTGVGGDATRAYAFWLKAAQMGNPQAMTFLGEKISATWDSPADGFWANIPIATQMLECAFGQGYGPAARRLSSLIVGVRPPSGRGNRTAETSARAVKLLHDGVKLGCEKCANSLFVEFDGGFNLADILPPFVDKARSQRYLVLADELSWNPNTRFPNLDQVLPLPPAHLPSWNGDKDALINAAMGVKPKPAPPEPTAASQRTDRHFLDAAFQLRYTGDRTDATRAPRTGYWQPIGIKQPERIRDLLARNPPGLYHADELFELFYDPNEADRSPVFAVVWERWDTQWHNDDAVELRAVTGQMREIDSAAPIMACPASRPCPATGVWQPWVHAQHPMRAIINQHWRQVWLSKGQPFPRPEQDWLLALPETDVMWHLMDDVGVAFA
ncbi:MAG: DUF6396 domain-containing protein [Pseudomonadota bacterium]